MTDTAGASARYRKLVAAREALLAAADALAAEAEYLRNSGCPADFALTQAPAEPVCLRQTGPILPLYGETKPC